MARLRSTAHDPAALGVGGVGTEITDFTAATYGNFWKMLTLIGLVTFALLAIAFRSLLLPAKAVALNFAAVAAANGVLVFAWQEGHGSDALWQVTATGAITFWAPVFVFAFLFGLSMDYEVFILSRIQEEYQATGSTPGAVVAGLGHTGRLVTSAALILGLAFVAMSSAPATAIKDRRPSASPQAARSSVLSRGLVYWCVSSNWMPSGSSNGSTSMPNEGSRVMPPWGTPCSSPTRR